MDKSGIPRSLYDPAVLWRRVADLTAKVGAGFAQRPVQNLVTATGPASTSLSAAGGGDTGWGTVGSALQVQTWGGTVAVTLAARLSLSAVKAGGEAAYGYTLTDANSNTVAAADWGRAVRVQNPGGAAIDAQSAFAVVHTGLAPGVYTLQPVARLQDGSGGTVSVSATLTNCSLIIQGL